MRAVLKLIVLYFTATPLASWLAAVGAVSIAIGCAAVARYAPAFTAQIGLPSQFSLAEEAALSALPSLGMLAVLAASTLLPLIVSHLATSHLIYVLPYGRLKVLASAAATVVMLALVAGGITVSYYVRLRVPLVAVFERAFVVATVSYSVLYVMFWIVSSIRNAVGLLAGALLILGSLALPLRFIAAPDTPVAWLALAALLGSAALGGTFMLAPRLTAALARLRARAAAASPRDARYLAGREVELLVGTARPWLVAIAQAAPVLAVTIFESDTKLWMLYLVLFGALAAAIASFAASRSRALWLRRDWTRAELFRRIEAAYWRLNGRAAALLTVVVVAAGVGRGLEARALVVGVVLLLSSTVVSTYLGLMMTKSIGWRETSLGVATMALLIATSIVSADSSIAPYVVASFAAALVGLAIGFRRAAQRRWIALDWMLCRPEVGTRLSS
jgi:hypothetical protein